MFDVKIEKLAIRKKKEIIDQLRSSCNREHFPFFCLRAAEDQQK